MKWLQRLLEKRPRAFLELSLSGQKTAQPKVHVSAHGSVPGVFASSQTVYTFLANDSGNAQAEMYGKGLAQIFGVRLVDRRKP